MKTDTLLLIGAAAVGVYLLTRPRVPSLGVNTYAGQQYPQQPQTALNYLSQPNPYGAAGSNQTAQIISASGSALSALSDVVSNFF